MTHPTDPVAAMREAWRDLCEKDDRTSPVEYPDMALITFDEFAAIRALPTPAAQPDPRRSEAEIRAELAEAIARAEKAERERDEARERADRAERFCARASTAAGEHGVCADAVSLRGELASARALIARAVEAIEQARTFADLQRRHRATDCACASCRRENDYVDSLAALAADLRKVGDSV